MKRKDFYVLDQYRATGVYTEKISRQKGIILAQYADAIYIAIRITQETLEKIPKWCVKCIMVKQNFFKSKAMTYHGRRKQNN